MLSLCRVVTRYCRFVCFLSCPTLLCSVWLIPSHQRLKQWNSCHCGETTASSSTRTTCSLLLSPVLSSLGTALSLQGFWNAYEGEENEEIRNTLKSIHDDLDDMTYFRPAWKKVQTSLMCMHFEKHWSNSSCFLLSTM